MFTVQSLDGLWRCMDAGKRS